jgi:hypothetical protein
MYINPCTQNHFTIFITILESIKVHKISISSMLQLNLGKRKNSFLVEFILCRTNWRHLMKTSLKLITVRIVTVVCYYSIKAENLFIHV